MTGFLVFLVSAISALTQTVTGFGFSIVIMAVLPIFLPYDASLLISVALSLPLNAMILWSRRDKINFKLLWLPLLFSSAGALSGLFLLSETPPEVYKRVLGVFLAVLALWFIFFSERVKIKPNAISGSLAGAVSGVCGGIFSITGPPMVLYFTSVISDKETYMATLQMYFLSLNVVLLTARTFMHMWPGGAISNMLWAALGLVFGVLAGKRVFEKIDAAMLKKIIYIFMIISGAYIAIAG